MVEGPCGDVYGAPVCTWAELEDERVVRLGATVPIESIRNAPAEAEMVWPPVEVVTLPLPEAAQERTGVRSLKLYWEAHGHPPGPYLVPHFDFHFYTISQADLEALDCSDVSKPADLPIGYDLPDVEIPELGNLIGLCVPKMGMHALRTEELESEEPFDGTLVIGYYGAKPIFVEPMLTRELLLQEQTFSLEVPQIAGSDTGVTLPPPFEPEYNASASAYRFIFTGFESVTVATAANGR